MLFHEKEDPKKTIRTIQNTRKVFIPIYLMALILIIALIYLYKNDYTINILSLTLSGIFLFFCIKYTEIHRMSHIWRINYNNFEHSSGIINKRIKKLDYLSISDIEVHQNVLQRLFDYGDIVIHQFAETLIIKSINEPKKVAEIIQEAIEQKRKENSLQRGKGN